MTFQNAKVIGANVDYATYSRQTAQRGSREFIMGRGELMNFATCPSRWLAGYESSESKATEWGKLIDALVLQPQSFEKLFAIYPDTYPCETTKKDPRAEKPWNNNATFCKEWKERLVAEGVTCLWPEEKLEADKAVTILLSDPQIRELIECSQKQVFVLAEWLDETGIVVPVKALIDLLPDVNHQRFGKTIADLKSTVSAAPRKWNRHCFDYNLDCQAALYTDLYEAATGESRCDWRHAIQESVPPYQTAKRWMETEYLTIGREKYTRALTYYCRCLDSGIWPDYDMSGRMVIDGWREISPEPWMLMSLMESGGTIPDPPALFSDEPTTQQVEELTP